MTSSSATWPTPERLRETAGALRRFIDLAQAHKIPDAPLAEIRTILTACEFMTEQLIASQIGFTGPTNLYREFAARQYYLVACRNGGSAPIPWPLLDEAIRAKYLTLADERVKQWTADEKEARKERENHLRT